MTFYTYTFRIKFKLLYEAGLTYEQMGKALGVPKWQLRRLRKQMDLDPRPWGRRPLS